MIKFLQCHWIFVDLHTMHIDRPHANKPFPKHVCAILVFPIQLNYANLQIVCRVLTTLILI